METATLVDRDLTIRLRTVICQLSRRLNAATPNVDLSPSAISVLGSVAANGPAGINELAECEGLNATMVSRIVGTLHARGLIERLQDPADRRAAYVTMTPEGRRTLVRVRTERRRRLIEGLEQISADEASNLFDALPALESLARQFGVATSSTDARGSVGAF